MIPLYPYPLARSLIRFDLSHGQREPGKYAVDKHALSRDPAAAREHIQCDALAEEDAPRFPADSGDVFDGLERLAFLEMPFHSTNGSENPLLI